MKFFSNILIILLCTLIIQACAKMVKPGGMVFFSTLNKTVKSFVFEISASKKEVDDLIKKLQPLGLASASRTGVVAMTKGSEIFK